jgi:hypothetical protein
LSGTWGDVVNDNITQMVEQAVAGKAVVNTWTGNSHTLTTADGTTSESRCAILELTDTGTALSGAGTVVCPTNTKLYIVDNNTAEIITVKTSGGTGIAVPVGKTMLVYCDGTNVVEGVTHANSLSLGTSTVTADKILDEDNMASDSATAIATQQSIKAYVDSQVGSFDTLAEVLAQGNTTGGTDIAVGTGDDITFADNSKAIFGAGSDLQIYHHPTDGSFIVDNGTGNLQLDATDFRVRNTAGTEAMIHANADGAVKLFYDGGATPKLQTTATGIDVTGSVTADGLTVDGDGLIQASTGAKVTIKSTTNFISPNDVVGSLDFVSADYNYPAQPIKNQIRSVATSPSGTGESALFISTTETTNLRDRIKIDYNGDISFYEDTGTTPKFFWDASAESLGIGTSSPDSPLEIQAATNSSSDTTYLKLYNAGENVGNIDFENGNGSLARITGTKEGAGASANDGILTFSTALDATLSEKMRISSNGNVGIGVVPKTGGSTWQHVQFGGTGNLIARKDDSIVDAMFSNNYYVNASNADSYITTGAAARMFINDNVISFDQAASGSTDAAITWSEALRIDSSGNLLAGKTATAFGTAGVEASASNGLWSTRSGLPALALNRLSTNGSIADFYQGGAAVGSVGSRGGVVSHIILDPRSGGAGLTAAGASLFPTDNAGAVSDGAIDLGYSVGGTNYRFKDLYLSGTSNVGVGRFTAQSLAHSAASLVLGHEGSSKSQIRAYGINAGTIGSLEFVVSASDGTGSNSMTLDASGNLVVGKSVGSSPATIGIEAQPDGEVYSTIATGYNTYHVYANSGYRFYVNPNGGLYNYSANNVNLSDEREKKNIELLESQWDSLKQWSLKKFHYNADAASDNKKLGVIAQEVATHNPEVIDEFNVDDDTTRLAVKEQQMMWMAIKALQEAQTRIESLEARVAALES